MSTIWRHQQLPNKSVALLPLADKSSCTRLNWGPGLLTFIQEQKIYCTSTQFVCTGFPNNTWKITQNLYSFYYWPPSAYWISNILNSPKQYQKRNITYEIVSWFPLNETYVFTFPRKLCCFWMNEEALRSAKGLQEKKVVASCRGREALQVVAGPSPTCSNLLLPSHSSTTTCPPLVAHCSLFAFFWSTTHIVDCISTLLQASVVL